jgi:hypothetical protein
MHSEFLRTTRIADLLQTLEKKPIVSLSAEAPINEVRFCTKSLHQRLITFLRCQQALQVLNEHGLHTLILHKEDEKGFKIYIGAINTYVSSICIRARP